jgi:hypothetical protein
MMKIKTYSWASAVIASAFLAVTPARLRAAPYDQGNSDSLQKERVSGTVQSIAPNSDLFILDAGGRRVTVLVRDADVIRGTDWRHPESFRSDMIRRGENVTAEGDWVDTGILRASVVRLSDSDVGSLLGASNDGRMTSREMRRRGQDGTMPPFREMTTDNGLHGILLRSPGNGDRDLHVTVRGKEIKVGVPKDVRVTRDGDRVSIHDLQKGDHVMVTGDWRGKSAIQASRVMVESYDGDSGYLQGGYIVGTVGRMDPNRRQMVLLTSDGAYDVDATDADVLQYDRIRPFSDLHRGDRVRVYSNETRGRLLIAQQIRMGDDYGDSGRAVSVRELFSNSADYQTGTIRGIDHLNRTFELRSGIKSKTVRVTSDTNLYDKNGDGIRFNELKEGQEVGVSGDTNDALGVIRADRVRVM